jgi:hypothetical protein
MIDQKSVIIGFIVSIVLVLALGFLLPNIGLGLTVAFAQFFAVLLGALVAGYLATKKKQIKVVESALHGILVGVFTGVVQILIIYVRSGFSEKVAGILIIAALVLIGAYIIVGALGGILGTLFQVKFGKSKVEIDEQPEQK